MHWLFLLIALGAFLVALTTPSPILLGICLLVALVLTVLFLFGLLAQRMGGSSGPTEVLRLDPEEVRRIRELAEARKAQKSGDAGAGLTAATIAGTAAGTAASAGSETAGRSE